ncbi:MAG: lysophospholipid acyltransferase family protein [Bacteroidales bacterium]
MLNVIYTFFFAIYFAVTAPLCVAFSALMFIVCYPFDKQRRVQHIISRRIANLYLPRPFGKVIVQGRENVKKNTTYVIVCNHQAMYDIVLLYKVPLFFKWISKQEVYRIPLVGQLLHLHGDVTIKRGDTRSVKKMMQDCSSVLQTKTSLMMFPEGTRSRNGRIGRFREGAFLLAKQNNVPILPVVIDGTNSFIGKRFVNASQILRVHILPEISAPEVASADIASTQNRVHQIMLSVQQEIQAKNK